MSEARDKAQAAHDAAPMLARLSAPRRSVAIRTAAQAVRDATKDILAANEQDMARGRAAGMPGPLLDRLLLDDSRIEGIVSSMDEVADQADPLARVVSGQTLPSGVRLEQVTVPLGVVAIVYEARPNVTADAIALCLRSGNACILRAGSAAHDSAKAITDAARAGAVSAGVPGECIALIESAGHEETQNLMRASGLVDVLIPRGGASLIRTCVEQATVPTIQTGVGNCHIYLEHTADPQDAVNIVVNAKTSRPGVCNAAESLLVDEGAAARLLPPVLEALADKGVELVGDELACSVAASSGVEMGRATEEDWGREYLDLKMSVRCVSGVQVAIDHINRYGTGHSEAIVTQDYEASERFLAGVDASVVYVNASTRFTDGGMFGLGCEIGISTQKLHVRGPMGASALTSTKYLARGEGQIR